MAGQALFQKAFPFLSRSKDQKLLNKLFFVLAMNIFLLYLFLSGKLELQCHDAGL
jgi:hypothetical protein